MSPAAAIIWIFLAIFVATAVLTLCSLPGWLTIKEAYRKKLFSLLILEVVGITVGFGAQALRSYGAAPKGDIASVMLSQERYGWDWQYSQKNWRSHIHFEHRGSNQMTMSGTTFVVKDGSNDVPILRWETKEPFAAPPNQSSVSFDAQRTWLSGAATLYPELQHEVGKPTAVRVTLQLGFALEGAASDESGSSWGMMLTSGFPR